MAHMRHLVEQLKKLEERLRAGGGPAKTERQHRAGKMAARERIAALLDPGTPFLEIGLLLAYDQYDGEAPGLGSVTGIGKIEGRYAVIIAGDATVKAGSWWPETVTKGLRAQEIAMRNRVPIVYLVDSAGVNLPHHCRIFPGQYGGGRIFYYNSLMRRKLRVPQIAAVMGPCIAGGAYLPALSDYIIMVEGTSFMGLGGPNLASIPPRPAPAPPRAPRRPRSRWPSLHATTPDRRPGGWWKPPRAAHHDLQDGGDRRTGRLLKPRCALSECVPAGFPIGLVEQGFAHPSVQRPGESSSPRWKRFRDLGDLFHYCPLQLKDRLPAPLPTPAKPPVLPPTSAQNG